MKDMTKEAERWGLEPKPASLWWTSTYADEIMDDIEIGTSTGLHKPPFERKFKILGIFSIKLGGRGTARKIGCRVRTRPGGEMRRSTDAMTYHGE